MTSTYHISSSPHTRSRLSTGEVMYDVVIALLPATFAGVFNFGLHALLVILASVIAAVTGEFVFDYICHKENTIRDGSAVVTGLLLALCLPSGVPLYVPAVGAVFAVVVVKGMFGGLGKNFMNPALAARCFLLISFGTAMTSYEYDAVSGATPLADIANGQTVNVMKLFLGSTNGVIGCSVFALMIGGLYLWVIGGITWEIPFSVLVSFWLFIAIFGGHGFEPYYMAAQICGGGIVMAAFFMATDPVSSPMTGKGQLIYGCIVGVLAGLFRVFGSSADSVSYAVIISNLTVPLIDEFVIPKPYAYRDQSGAKGMVFSDEPEKTETKAEKKAFTFPKAAVILCVITVIAGFALSYVYSITKDAIAEQQLKKNIASYQEVLPDATNFTYDEAISQKVTDLGGETYGTDFGKSVINDVIVGTDDAGNVVGYVISVTSNDAYDGSLTLSAGISADGTLNGISFTELNETAGMGMRAEEPEFKDQFAGKNVEKFTLNKSGNSSSDDEIDTISGASTTSGAVVNAVNAALDFYRNNIAAG